MLRIAVMSDIRGAIPFGLLYGQMYQGGIFPRHNDKDGNRQQYFRDDH